MVINPKDEGENVRIAHFTIIQGVVSRMGNNSFALKALSATFCGVALVVTDRTGTFSIYHLLAYGIPLFVFWCMDVRYLWSERAYRKLYDKVRMGEGIDIYSLDLQPVEKDMESVFFIATSWSVWWYYAVLFGFVCGASYLIGLK